MYSSQRTPTPPFGSSTRNEQCQSPFQHLRSLWMKSPTQVQQKRHVQPSANCWHTSENDTATTSPCHELLQSVEFLRSFLWEKCSIMVRQEHLNQQKPPVEDAPVDSLLWKGSWHDPLSQTTRFMEVSPITKERDGFPHRMVIEWLYRQLNGSVENDEDYEPSACLDLGDDLVVRLQRTGVALPPFLLSSSMPTSQDLFCYPGSVLPVLRLPVPPLHMVIGRASEMRICQQTDEAYWTYGLGAVQMTVTTSQTKWQHILQLVSLSRESVWGQAVVLLCTNGHRQWYLFWYKGRNQVVCEQFANGRVCLNQFVMLLLQSVGERYSELEDECSCHDSSASVPSNDKRLLGRRPNKRRSGDTGNSVRYSSDDEEAPRKKRARTAGPKDDCRPLEVVMTEMTRGRSRDGGS